MKDRRLTGEQVIGVLRGITRYIGKTVVVKIDGSSINGDALFLPQLAEQFNILQRLDVKVVLVHGAEPQINALLDAMGYDRNFVDGNRIVSVEQMPIVADELTKVSHVVAGHFTDAGCKTVVPTELSRNFIYASPLEGDGTKDRTGKPELVFLDNIQSALRKGVVILNSVARGSGHDIFNVNANTVAAMIAGALKAERLVFLTSRPGVFGEDMNLISALSCRNAEELIQNKVIYGRMILKIKGATDALAKGVGGVSIIDGHEHYGLLAELAEGGFGTLITKAGPERPLEKKLEKDIAYMPSLS